MSRLADIYRTDMKEDAPEHLERAPNPKDSDGLSIDSGGQKFGHMGEENQPKSMDGEVAAMLAASGGRVVLTPEDNKLLKRMIDKRVLSVMLLVYFFQGLDKGTIGFASLMGIRDDAHLVGQEYSWLSTIFYLAAICNEAFANLLVQKLPVAKFLGASVAAWGICLASHAAAHNFATLMVVRFLLGWFEAAVQPSFLILTSTWYKREEQSATLSYWYATNGLQQAIGGLLAVGFSQIKHGEHMNGWKAMFLTLGCITFLLGLFILWFLPDSIMRAKCFSEHDRIRMLERVRSNQSGVQSKVYKWSQGLEALRDPAVWILFILQVLNCLTSGGAAAFGQIILSSFGFTTEQAQFLSVPQGAVMVFACIFPAWLAQRLNQTIYVMMGLIIPIIAGAAVIMKVTATEKTRVGLLICFYLILMLYGVSVLIYSTLTRNIAGRSKVTTATILVFLGWGAGNAIGPQCFRSQDAPQYKTGFAIYLAASGAQFVLLAGLRALYIARNIAKEKRRAKNRDGDVAIRTENAFDDMTDGQNDDFVYQY